MSNKSNKLDFEKIILKVTKPVLLLSVGIFIGATVIHIWNLNYSFNPSSGALLGDFLGGYLGAGLSILTVLLLYQTYISQKKELIQQREELESQREVLNSQLDENKYNRTLNSIIFELEILQVHIKEFLTNADLEKHQKYPYNNTYNQLFNYRNRLENNPSFSYLSENDKDLYLDYFLGIFNQENYELCLKILDSCRTLKYLSRELNIDDDIYIIIANRIGLSFFHIAGESIKIIKLLELDKQPQKFNAVLNSLETIYKYYQYTNY